MRHSRHLLQGTAEDLKKPQDSTTGILLDISTYDLGNTALIHVTYNIQCSKQSAKLRQYTKSRTRHSFCLILLYEIRHERCATQRCLQDCVTSTGLESRWAIIFMAPSDAAKYGTVRPTGSYAAQVYPNTVIEFYVWVSVHHNSILCKEPTRCNFGCIVY